MNIDRRTIVRRVLAVVGFLILIPVVALGALWLSARSSDGPSVVFAGGPLVSGELVTGPEPDWSFVRDIRVIELQLLDPPRSRTLWIVEVDGRIFLNSNYMASWLGRLWKRWPDQATQYGRAILRVEGKRYERLLVPITTGPLVERIAEAFNQKYRAGMTRAEVEEGKLRLFEMAPPDASMTGGAR